MASQNEASIWVSSAPIAVRNTPRSRCSSAHHQRSSDLSTSASASFIASRASEVRSARCKASAFSARKYGRPSDRAGCPIVSYSVLDPRDAFRWCHRKRCAPNREESLLQPANAQNCDALTVQSNPMPSVPLQQDYAHSRRESLHNHSATANACISFSSFASEIASAMVAWQEAISPKCHSDSAS